MYYGMFHTFMYEWKPISDRKIQHKCRCNTQTAKNVQVGNPLQDATGRHRPPQDRDVAKCLAAVVDLEVTFRRQLMYCTVS